MESFFSRYKNPLILALLLIAQFVLLAVQVRPRLPGAAAADQAGVLALRKGVTTLVTPPEKVAHSGGLGVRGLWSQYVDLIGLKQQNEQLEAENQRLQMEEVALAEDARQGERLQELLAFKQHYIDTTIPAQIVGTGGSDHGRVVYIDKGLDDGIQPDMPVITPDGVVGKVRDVTASTAQVLEISDPTSAAGVVLEQTRTRGIVRGNAAGQPEIVDMMPDSRIQPGQLVITSGGDQIFPRGLPIGTVLKIIPDDQNPPLVNVILKPAANLGRLEEVLVVTKTETTPSATARADMARSESTAAQLKANAAAQAAGAAEAALETQSAADVLAARLPSATDVTDPDAPDAAAGSGPTTANESGPALHPPAALHPDHYSPGDTPSAQDLTPGQRAAPYLQGKIPTVRVTPQGQGDALQEQQPGVSAAFLAAHQAAVAAARRGPTAGHPAQTRVGQPASPATHTPLSGPVRKSSGASDVAASHTVGATRPSATNRTFSPTHSSGAARPSGGVAGQRPEGVPTHARPSGSAGVPMRVIDDGPVTPQRHTTESPAHHAAPADQAKPRTERPRKPALVPEDGSRPPSTTPQEHF